MIFGFNTDVKHEDTVYHVQSEARQAEHLLQTQVFVRGRCIGKHASPYSAGPGDSSSDPQIEQLLREQHRIVLDAVRAGRVESVLDKTDPSTLAVAPLDVQWLNAADAYSSSQLLLHLRVTEGDTAIAGAELVSRLQSEGREPVYQQAVTEASGLADIQFAADEATLATSLVLVQVKLQGRTATRKFQFRKAV